ncbi:hypothetical protein BBK36DRAFT_1107697 [Trichoderma citrinoviride]|uniref:Uncharacterized protein n=1 Tax=Trichoderma citrinoviride TaxID=58853 RepID=A0A2T4BM78_9HYPO|nr:hypothetical protein BBK36DRAFT_1107697 [Trichoderma citrinoviride]PTB70417.1 hypothetical protein BBK36DRAFT_1107697 [Trichoderma citrinoviride]
MSGGIHLKLTPQCGICTGGLKWDDTAVAVYRTTIITITTTTTLALDSTSMTTTTSHNAVWDCSPPFKLSHRDLMASLVLSRITPETSFCYEYRECSACATSSEAVALHQDCYEILTARCRLKDTQLLLRRLLEVASWRKPWRGARPLLLPRNVDKPRLDVVAKHLGLPQLSALPVELADMILQRSADALLWRGIAAWRLAECLASMRDDPRQPQIMWLREILSWERGGELVTSQLQALPPVVRLTLDSDGIRCVERLSGQPAYLRGGHTHTAYIVASVNDETLRHVRAELAHGQMRLQLPADGPVPHIWNTPTPPLLSSCRLFGSASTTWSRLFAVESDSMRGITFFYSRGRLCDIHIHYLEGSSAQSTYDQMSRGLQQDTSWLYLPISKGDRLTILGGSGASLTFIYGEPKRGGATPRVELVGTYCGASTPYTERLPDKFPLDKFQPSPISDLEEVYFSWAPLEDVASTVVFRDRGTGYCKGILFHYLNGGSRAIGQCRLQVDPAERVDGPSSLCIQMEGHRARWSRTQMLYKARVEFQQGPGQEHEHEGRSKALVLGEASNGEKWRCFPMRGYAKFWFTAESSWLSIVTENEQGEEEQVSGDTETAAQM